MPHPPLSVWALIPERLASTDCLNQDPNQSQPMRGAHRHQEVIRHTSKNQGVWEELGGFSSSSPPQIVIWYWLHLPLYLLLGSTCSVTTASSSLFLACSFNSQRGWRWLLCPAMDVSAIHCFFSSCPYLSTVSSWNDAGLSSLNFDICFLRRPCLICEQFIPKQLRSPMCGF